MVLACERDLHVSFSFGPVALNPRKSGIPPGAQLLDFLGPFGISGAYLIARSVKVRPVSHDLS